MTDSVYEKQTHIDRAYNALANWTIFYHASFSIAFHFGCVIWAIAYFVRVLEK